MFKKLKRKLLIKLLQQEKEQWNFEELSAVIDLEYRSDKLNDDFIDVTQDWYYNSVKMQQSIDYILNHYEVADVVHGKYMSKTKLEEFFNVRLKWYQKFYLKFLSIKRR